MLRWNARTLTTIAIALSKRASETEADMDQHNAGLPLSVALRVSSTSSDNGLLDQQCPPTPDWRGHSAILFNERYKGVHFEAPDKYDFDPNAYYSSDAHISDYSLTYEGDECRESELGDVWEEEGFLLNDNVESRSINSDASLSKEAAVKQMSTRRKRLPPSVVAERKER